MVLRLEILAYGLLTEALGRKIVIQGERKLDLLLQESVGIEAQQGRFRRSGFPIQKRPC